MSSTNPFNPRWAEVWDVNFNPTVGAEIRKIRPAVVISSDDMGNLPIKLVAPITSWKNHFEHNTWHVRVEPNDTNGLTGDSAIDVMQIRGVDLSRFIRKRGRLDATFIEEIALVINTVMGNE